MTTFAEHIPLAPQEIVLANDDANQRAITYDLSKHWYCMYIGRNGDKPRRTIVYTDFSSLAKAWADTRINSVWATSDIHWSMKDALAIVDQVALETHGWIFSDSERQSVAADIFSQLDYLSNWKDAAIAQGNKLLRDTAETLIHK